MKQRITVNELSKLSDDQKDSLHKWWTPKKGDLYTWHYTDGNKSDHAEYMVTDTHHNIFDDPEANLIAIPLLSIGQMIELLLDKNAFESEYGYDPMDTSGSVALYWSGKLLDQELCDALWDDVRKVI